MRVLRVITVVTLSVLTGCVASGKRQKAIWRWNDAGVSFQLPTDPEWERIPVDANRFEPKLVYQRRDKMAVVEFDFLEKYPPAQRMDGFYVEGWEKVHYRRHDERKVSDDADGHSVHVEHPTGGGTIRVHRCAFVVEIPVS